MSKNLLKLVRGYISLWMYMLYWSYALETRALSGGKTRHVLYQWFSIVRKKVKKRGLVLRILRLVSLNPPVLWLPIFRISRCLNWTQLLVVESLTWHVVKWRRDSARISVLPPDETVILDNFHRYYTENHFPAN